MSSKYCRTFFASKRPWSNYKDQILGYYLRPYLQKVKNIGKPITVVDMFAGRGEFETGEPGSPLIIARILQPLAESGYQVRLRCYETYEPFFEHLTRSLESFPYAEAILKDSLADVHYLATRAVTDTTLLYVDPCDVSQLSLAQLGTIYDAVQKNASVEALLVFMARAFMRQAAQAWKLEMRLDECGAMNDALVSEAMEDDRLMWLEALYSEGADLYSQSRQSHTMLSEIAGGDYWKEIVGHPTVSWGEKCEMLVASYTAQLRKWFNVAEALPLHADNSSIPKYWMVFASRYKPAFDLFNRAACQMIRAQRQNFRQPGTLFAGMEAQAERACDEIVDREVKRAMKRTRETQWQELRWCVCGNRNVGRFTDSEVNQAIKRMIKGGWLAGSTGKTVEDEAVLRATSHLSSWVDR